jgi:predicted RNase H-like HicB family nuclease
MREAPWHPELSRTYPPFNTSHHPIIELPIRFVSREVYLKQWYTKKEIHMRYKIALEQNEEGFSVSVPGLPGCWSQGETEQEALENIQEAVREYLSVRDELLKNATVREIEVAV